MGIAGVPEEEASDAATTHGAGKKRAKQTCAGYPLQTDLILGWNPHLWSLSLSLPLFFLSLFSHLIWSPRMPSHRQYGSNVNVNMLRLSVANVNCTHATIAQLSAEKLTYLETNIRLYRWGYRFSSIKRLNALLMFIYHLNSYKKIII